MADDTFYVAPDALARLRPAKSPLKAYTFDFTLAGQLVIVADSPADAYRQAIMWSPEALAGIASLEMEDPEEAGSVQ